MGLLIDIGGLTWVLNDNLKNSYIVISLNVNQCPLCVPLIY